MHMQNHEMYGAVVIGGGYFGCAAAYYLTKAGVKTMLIERGEIAGCASGANFGNVQVQDSNMGLSFQLTLEGFHLMQNMTEELGCDIGYETCPSIITAETEKHIPMLRQLYEEKKNAGLDIRWLEGDDVTKAEPNLAKGTVLAATQFVQGKVYPFSYLYALIRRARENGLTVAENSEVGSLYLESGECRGVVLKDGTVIRAEHVIAAAGSGTGRLCASAGLDVPVLSVKAECIVTEALAPFLKNYYSSAAFFAEAHDPERASTSLCISQSHYGNLLIAETTKPYKIVRPEYYDLCSMEHCENIRELIIKYFPALENIQVLRSWCVPSPATADYNPILGKSPVPGLIIDAGFKSAVVMSAISGIIVTDLVTKDSCPYELNSFTACIGRNRE
mgnify:CR=1 FL=1